MVALHILYRHGFAAAVGGDFVATGMTQRLVWEGLLIGFGWLLWRRGLRGGARAFAIAGPAHALYYGLLLPNPLLADQAVGASPLVTLLLPLDRKRFFSGKRVSARFDLEGCLNITTQ